MDYDGEEHYSTVKNLPAGVGVTYEYRYEKYNKDKPSELPESVKLDGKPVYGGSYRIYATFYAENDSVIVNKDELMADSVSFEYVKGTTTYHTGDFT